MNLVDDHVSLIYSGEAVRIAAHMFSGEAYMERVAPGAGQAKVFSNIISGEDSPGIFPASPVECKGAGRIVLRNLFANSATGMSVLPLAYDEGENMIGPLVSSSTETSIEVVPTQAQTEGKKAGPVISVSNEDVGACYFRLQLLSVSGEVFVDYSLI